MKKIYLISTIILFLTSCYADKGNYDYKEINSTKVLGIESKYTQYLNSTIKINPTIESTLKSSNFNYMWMCYDKVASNVIPKLDTLSMDKDLNWSINVKPAIYELIFSYTDKNTNVTEYVKSELVVESKYSRGWYVLKKKNSNTDIDFFSDSYSSFDILAAGDGALLGTPSSLAFEATYAYLDENTGVVSKNVKSIVVTSEKDIRILKIEDMSIIGNFESIFFEKPEVKSPGMWFSSSDEIYLINNKRLNVIDARTSPLGLAKFSYPKNVTEGDYRLSPIMTKNGTMAPLLFDEISGKFCTSHRGTKTISLLKSDAQSLFPDTYLNMNPIYAGFLDKGMWVGGKGYVVMQESTSAQRNILHFNLDCLISFNPNVNKNRIIDIDKLPLASNVNKASYYGMNRIFEIMYFSIGDKLYTYDLLNKIEKEITTVSGKSAVPAGENICMIKHINYNDTYSAPDEYINKLIIATISGNGYKLYTYEMSADKLEDNPIINSGEGQPIQVMYMSSQMNNGYICY